MGALHPEVVHLAIGLLFLGVTLRVVSLAGRPAFPNFSRIRQRIDQFQRSGGNAGGK